MNPLVELANKTWIDLEDLLKDFDNHENECQLFVNDTNFFFQQRLSIYRQKRIELENHIEKLAEQMYQLCDELQIQRIHLDQQLTLKDKQLFINEKINYFKTLIFQRDKELIQLRHLIDQKINLIGNIQMNTEQIKSLNEAKSILLNFKNQFKTYKENIDKIWKKIHSINPEYSTNFEQIVSTFLSVNDENELVWINTNSPLTAFALHSQLVLQYEKLREILLKEILQLRSELDQNEPDPSCDLEDELVNLRLRKRYLTFLSSYPHKLTSKSTLDEIRQIYEQVTASLRAQAKEKLKYLWDQLDVPKDQRILLKSKTNQDDYLAMIDEIQRLEIYVESIRSILVKIQKREWFKKEMVEFEKRAANPARLKGSSTQLLKEEKFRKDLSREFPKLTDDLHRMVAEWEESSGNKLIYGGEPYLETMNKEKLGVDFELLHLRLLTKCQLLVQSSQNQILQPQINEQPSPPSSSRRLISDTNHSRSTSTPPLSRNRTSTSRIPTMNFVNSNRKK